MKNYLLLIFLLTVVSLNAQFSGERERNLQLLAIEANEIVSSKAPLATREAMVVKLITNYLNTKSTTSVNTELDKLYKDVAHDGKCNTKRVGVLVKTFSEQKKNVLSDEYISSFGNVKTDCELATAVKLYYILGPDKVATKDICATIGCDKNSDVRMKSRGVETYWKYTGEKTYVVDDEVFGWRYKCILVTKEDGEDAKSNDRPLPEKGDRTRKDESDNVVNVGTSRVMYKPVADKEPEWKKEDMVDLWL